VLDTKLKNLRVQYESVDEIPKPEYWYVFKSYTRKLSL